MRSKEKEVVALGRKLARLGVEAVAILFLNCYVNPAHEAARQSPARGEASRAVRLRLARAVAGIPRVRALLDGRRQRLYRARACGATSARSTSTSAPPASTGSFLVVQSTGGLYEAEQAKSHCVRMLESGPAAGVIGTQALCHALGLRQRDRLRHGRHHRQGRRHLPGRGAHHRHGADRRLRPGAAGPDRHDGHLRGRHRRRLDRPGRERRAARRPAERRRRAGPGLLRRSAAPSRP